LNIQFLVISLTLLLEFGFGLFRKPCFVIENKSNETKRCIFPFALKSDPKFTYNGCTSKYMKNGRFWCSTKIDENGIHERGHWGYCNSNCSIPDEKTQIAHDINFIIKTVGARKNENCQCKKLMECDWSKEIYDDVTKLDEKDPLRKKSIRFLKRHVCADKNRQIHCCDFSKRPTPGITTNPDSYSGTWIPTKPGKECGSRLTLNNIIGGENAKLGEFPYMALLGYRLGKVYYYLCGGSVLNSKYVLTAAHCHSDDQPIEQVVVGEHTINNNPDCRVAGDFCLPDPQRMSIDKVIQHPKWNIETYRQGFDIALVRVQGNIHLFGLSDHTFVSPICLPWNSGDPGYSTSPGEELTVTGWGSTTNSLAKVNENYEKYQAATGTLQKVKLPSLDYNACVETFEIVDYNIQLCAGGEKGKDSCKGDSGGPLVKISDSTYYQVGVVSFGSQRCGNRVPAMYTRISGFLDWIKESLEP